MIIVAYRAEKFIRAAVKGAFSQTYSPLEIILSDDCSSDTTFEIIREMAAEYQGPHRIQINRNERNLGLCGHINRCMELANGELIVGAAGDDVSLPERTEAIVETWESSGRWAYSIYSDSIIMSEDGCDLGVNRYPPAKFQGDLLQLIRRNKVGVMGCTHAWHRETFQRFGPLNVDVVNEDAVIPVRSRLLGGVAYIPRPLVRQRMSAGSITRPRQEGGLVEHIMAQRAVRAREKLTAYRQWLCDLQKWGAMNPELERLIEAMCSQVEFDWAMQQPGFQLRWLAFLKAIRHPRNIRHAMHWYAFCAFAPVYHLWIQRRLFWEKLRKRGFYKPAG
ncbi:MAG TPA: glycosyltransferase [Verrucomicrobiae bacterium]